MEFFNSPDDLKGWIKSRHTCDEAISGLLDITNTHDQSVSDVCEKIFDSQEDSEVEKDSTILFGVLAKHLAEIKTAKGAKNMEKLAQNSPSMSRQRNGWVKGMRNKWNRVVDGFNDGTPWRIDRDKMYDFTHYYIDDIKFDEDPSRVYSGEAIWRMYVMDKFTTEYMNKEGKWVGGYINDRFFVFPDAGTPANPDVPRDGGNQMGLAPGQRSRLPRPHQYSTERRLEEARDGNTTDVTVNITASSTKSVKISYKLNKDERHSDKVYNIFKDVLDMDEAGIEFKTIIEEASKHYDTSILKIAQIYKAAKKLKAKHEGMLFSYAGETLGSSVQDVDTWTLQQPVNAIDMDNNPITIPAGATITKFDETIVGDASTGSELKVKFENKVVKIDNWENVPADPVGNIQTAATDLGLNEEVQSSQPKEAVSTNFEINEIPKQ